MIEARPEDLGEPRCAESLSVGVGLTLR